MGSRKWIFVTSPRNFEICKKYSVYGVSERYEETATKHIDKGDQVFFYIKKRKRFNGPWEIASKGKWDESHPAVSEWEGQEKYVIIIPLKPNENIGECNLDSVFSKLYFITNRRKCGKGGYSDHFQFSIISIRDEDFNTILRETIKTIKLSNFSSSSNKLTIK